MPGKGRKKITKNPEMALRLKQVRQEIHLTQEEFGQILGMSRNSVANLEGCRTQFKDMNMKLLYYAFGVSEDWLKTGKGPMFVSKDKPPKTKKKGGRSCAE